MSYPTSQDYFKAAANLKALRAQVTCPITLEQLDRAISNATIAAAEALLHEIKVLRAEVQQ